MSEFPERALPIYEAVWRRIYWNDACWIFANTFSPHNIAGTGVKFSSGCIQAEYQAFEYVLERPDGQCYIIDLPWSAKEDLELIYARWLDDLPTEAVECVRKDAEYAWTLMVASLHSSGVAGKTSIWARVGSAFAPVTAVPSDVWAHFVVTDWERGVAVCEESGERLFSVHAQQTAFVDLQEFDDPSDALKAECAKRETPMTIAEMNAWAADRGLPRSFVREFRKALPSSEKLTAGEKKRDRSRQT